VATGVLNLALGGAALLAVSGAAPAEEADDVGTAEHAAAPPPAGADDATRRLALAVIALTAFASLLYEIAWTRVLVLVVGSSTYAFTTILACFLLGIGLGSLLAIGRGRAARDLLLRAALVQGAIAVAAALLFPFFRALPVYIIATLQVGFLDPTALLTLHGLALAVVVIPPAVGLGLAFPLLAEVAARGGSTAGGDTGRSYFANTVGSIAGAVVTGFLLIHVIGSEKTLILGVTVNVACAALLGWWLYRARGGTGIMLAGERLPLVLGVLGLVIALFTPSWSSRLLDRGPAIYGRDRMGARELDSFLRAVGSEQLFFDEGWNAAISVWRNGNATWLKSNGKADASSVADMNTQVMLSLLPAAAHPAPRRAFVIGFGSGVTVRALADVPGVERIDVAEIERAVLRAAPLFAHVNNDVHADPRVRLIEDDARSALQLAEGSYDLIVSEPSNPWIAGIASLFTAEYFRVAASRLAEDGVYSQWVQTYRVPASVVAVVVANLRAVFPHVEMWYSSASDLVLLASRRPLTWRRARVAALVDGATTAPLFREWLEVPRPERLLGRFLLGDSGTARFARTAGFTHDDDRPTLEFIAARGLLAPSVATGVFDSILGIRQLARDSLPRLEGWTLARGEWQAAYAYALPPDSRLTRMMGSMAMTEDSANAEVRRGVARQQYVRRDFAAARVNVDAALRRLPDDPELLVMAGVIAGNLGDPARARDFIRRAEAAGGDSALTASLLAEMALGDGDWQGGAALAARALRALRPSIARPFPVALQNVVRNFALYGPPPFAAPVLELARETRPSWDLPVYGGVQLFARWGGPQCRRAAELSDELYRFGWEPPEIRALLQPCERR
jgi:spermidine synthase